MLNEGVILEKMATIRYANTYCCGRATVDDIVKAVLTKEELRSIYGRIIWSCRNYFIEDAWDNFDRFKILLEEFFGYQRAGQKYRQNNLMPMSDKMKDDDFRTFYLAKCSWRNALLNKYKNEIRQFIPLIPKELLVSKHVDFNDKVDYSSFESRLFWTNYKNDEMSKWIIDEEFRLLNENLFDSEGNCLWKMYDYEAPNSLLDIELMMEKVVFAGFFRDATFGVYSLGDALARVTSSDEKDSLLYKLVDMFRGYFYKSQQCVTDFRKGNNIENRFDERFKKLLTDFYGFKWLPGSVTSATSVEEVETLEEYQNLVELRRILFNKFRNRFIAQITSDAKMGKFARCLSESEEMGVLSPDTDIPFGFSLKNYWDSFEK